MASCGGARRLVGAALCSVLASGAAGAQSALPSVTDLETLLAYPAFYHQRQVVVLGTFSTDGDDQWLVGPEGTRIALVGADPSRVPDGLVEIRADAIDVGRTKPDDARLAPLKLQRVVERDGLGPWPGPGALVVLRPRTARRWRQPQRPTLHDVALAPGLYRGHEVTIAGVFHGRNLYGEVPVAPGRDGVEYLLRSRDAALWVSGLPPRGDGFDLDPSSRLDLGCVVEVTGLVRKAGAFSWIEGKTIRLANDVPEPEPEPEAPPQIGPAPEVLFSVPTPDEADVDVGTTVRIQLSQSMAGASFDGRVRVLYEGLSRPPAAERLDSPVFVAAYEPKDRRLVIRFEKPLERFRTVRVDLLPGIKAVDGRELEAWTLRFTTGNREPR